MFFWEVVRVFWGKIIRKQWFLDKFSDNQTWDKEHMMCFEKFTFNIVSFVLVITSFVLKIIISYLVPAIEVAFNYFVLYIAFEIEFSEWRALNVLTSFVKIGLGHIQNDVFLAVHNSSIGDLVTDSLTQSVTFTFDITEWP